MNNTNPIRVLHIVGGPMDFGGTEMFLMNYHRNINRNLIQFDYLIIEEGEGIFDYEINKLGGKVYYIPSKRTKFVLHFRKLLRVLNEYRNLPVHMHLDGMNGLYGFIALLNRNKFRISHSHNTNHLTSKIIGKFIHDSFRVLNRFVNNHYAACSKEASYWLHGRVCSKKSTIILNAIEINKFLFDSDSRFNLRQKFAIEDEIVIGHVGRFHDQKNHTFMLELAKYLKSNGVNFRMLFIGEGEHFQATKDYISLNNLGSVIILIGKSDIPQVYYNMMDVFILPSLFEGLGIVLVEAQTNGLPCLISPNIPSEAFLSNNITVLPITDPKIWASKLIEMTFERNTVHFNSYDINRASVKIVEFYTSLVGT
jgi:glycosyltransferase EpsF